MQLSHFFIWCIDIVRSFFLKAKYCIDASISRLKLSIKYRISCKIFFINRIAFNFIYWKSIVIKITPRLLKISQFKCTVHSKILIPRNILTTPILKVVEKSCLHESYLSLIFYSSVIVKLSWGTVHIFISLTKFENHSMKPYIFLHYSITMYYLHRI